MNSTITNIDTCKCLSRKNKSNGIYLQCSRQKKDGDFCGIHSKSKEILRVDKELPQKYLKYLELSNFLKKREKIFSKVSILELINTHKYYNVPLPKSNKKDDLVESCHSNFLILEKFSSKNNMNSVIKIQKKIRDYLKNKEIILRGPGYTQRHECNNQDDFLSFEPVNEIPNKYFFSFKDKDNFIYGFDIRSFSKLIQNKMSNPYNRNDIPELAKKNLKKLIHNPKYNLEDIENDEITQEQKMSQRVLKVFQKIDQLDTYAGGTNINWFLNLSRIQLREYYKVLEDIWNYRSELSLSRKNMIVPNKRMFPMSVPSFYKMNEKKKMRKIILHEMDKLVDSASIREDKILGSYYVLIGLVEVSTEVASSLPWLVQV
jgi:hypothetical protein